MNIRYITRKRGEGKTQKLIEVLEECARAGIPCVVYHAFSKDTDDFIHSFINHVGCHPSSMNIKFINASQFPREVFADNTTFFVDDLAKNFPSFLHYGAQFTLIATINAEDVRY